MDEFRNPMFSTKTQRYIDETVTDTLVKIGHRQLTELKSNVPYRYNPNKKIPLWLIIEFGRIAIGEINKARQYDDVPICREEAIKNIRQLAEQNGVDHLVDYESFLYIVM